MESLFIRHSDPRRIADMARDYRLDRVEGFVGPADWPSVPSYPTTIKISPLRQDLADSADFPRLWPSTLSEGGERLELEWLMLVEAHDRIDLRLAGFLSREARTVAIAVHASDGADEYGHCTYRDGDLANQYFREREERATYRIDQELEIQRIPYTIRLYRDCNGPGWTHLRLDPSA